MSLLFGFFTAVGFGAGDFFGGLASRRLPAMTVSLYSQVVAALLLLLAAGVFGGLPGPGNLFWGSVAGLAVGVGIVRYYHGLSQGSMGWVAVAMGVVSALVPFVLGIALGERPSLLAVAGIFTILLSLMVVTRKRGLNRQSLTGLINGVFAGACFGFSFVFLSLGLGENPLWPVTMTALASLPPILLLKSRSRFLWRASRVDALPVVATGACQAFGFLAFSLAVLDGLVSVVSVAGALSPVLTIVLARAFLAEVLTLRQYAGLFIAILGILLIVAGSMAGGVVEPVTESVISLFDVHFQNEELPGLLGETGVGANADAF
jgi:drug/metabolite transporter (DMT)-like permease